MTDFSYTSLILPKYNREGFTLIETLVAMTVLAVSLTVIFQLFSGGLRAAGLSEDYTRAIFHAREKMEEILLAEGLADGVVEGEINEMYGWSARIEHNLPDPENEVGPPALDTFKITVNVAWKDGIREKHFEISTLKIAKLIETEDDDV